MVEESANNEFLLKALKASGTNTTLCMPPKMISAPTLTLPKPICSIQQSQFYQPPARIIKEENTTMNQESSPVVNEKEGGMIALEHCYARPLNWKPDSSFYQPTKLLFMEKPPRKKTNPLALCEDDPANDVIDVENVQLLPTEIYDKPKAIYLMNECERYVEAAKIYQTDDDWEESITKINWSPVQHKLFNKMASILNDDQLARLANIGNHHEPIQRRTLIDKSVKRIRKLFAGFSWDTKLTQWLHQLLLDHLSPPYLSAYFDILQTLRSKLKEFVEKMVSGPSSGSRIGPTNYDNMTSLLKRTWDPFSSYLTHNKPKKLPSNTVIIIVPSAPSTSNTILFKRQHKWMNLFAGLCTVVAVHTNIGNNSDRLTMINCADQMLTATRAKVQEVKADFPGKTIVLVGFNAGAALALQVAQVESVFCVVCMGFSVLTVEGKRGEPDDSLLELQCPVLFVIGQCSNTSSQEDLEDLRERMRVENGLIVVGSADDYLRVNKKKKRAEGITQTFVDRIITDNVGEFIGSLLLSPYPPQVRQSPTQPVNDYSGSKRIKMERTRNNSNCSSLESEPPSPTPKVTRPVGRPPGSKSKNKLEAKWTSQVVQGTIPSPSPSQTQLTSKPQPNTPSLEHFLTSSLSGNNANKSHILTDNSDKDSSIEPSANSATDKTELGSTMPSIITAPNKISMPTVSKPSSGIKVFENITLNSATNGKPVTSSKAGVDLSKITVLNTLNPSTSKNLSNVVLLPDGKIKTITSTVKGPSGTPLLLPLSHKNKPTISQMSHSLKHGVTKYITSKKQLLGRKPPFPSQPPPMLTSFGSSLPPPTNLTSQDIMDLPIIFADDNQMLTDNSELQQVDVPVSDIIQPVQPPKLPLSNPVGKFVFLNKQQPLLQSLSTPVLKRPTLSVPVRTTANPVKYTKIIISRGLNSDTKTTPAATNTLTKITRLSPEVSIRRIETAGTSSANMPEPMDLETNLVATAIPKPEYRITIKAEQDYEVAKLEKAAEIIKRNAMAANTNPYDDDDPDYIPPKSAKLK